MEGSKIVCKLACVVCMEKLSSEQIDASRRLSQNLSKLG